ncbi:MAG: inosine/xanthosine triphosphatase [bacterium]
MRIIVGSRNPVKIGAVEEAFNKYFSDCEVVGVEVVSGVSTQPMSERETMNGARQRAYGALESDLAADYGVGLEGGVTELNPTSPNWTGVHGGKGKMFECAWVAVLERGGSEGLGGGLYFELPKKVAEKIRAGGELGPVMDEMSGQDNVKQKQGAIGMFTKGKLDRKQAYVQIVLQALIKFVSPEWFD